MLVVDCTSLPLTTISLCRVKNAPIRTVKSWDPKFVAIVDTWSIAFYSFCYKKWDPKVALDW